MPATKTEQLAALAKTAAQCFNTSERDNGDTFYTLDNTSPEWVRDLVYKAHADFGPDDYRYEWAYRACVAIAEADEDISPRT